MILNKKKLLFISGTRADFGKLKSLILICQNSNQFDVEIFVTGMHLHHKYGYTVNEIINSGVNNIYRFINYTNESSMDLTLAKTIEGISSYVKESRPDLLIVHGDRVEALAGAISGALNNILVGHIEGGEISGTIDELIRHSVSKLSHAHFVSNKNAFNRLVQLGEISHNIFEIGSPDIDLMNPDVLPNLNEVLSHYQIPFLDYALVMYHPVTTEYDYISNHIKCLFNVLKKKNLNYIVIYPNNDFGSNLILKEFETLKRTSNFRFFPSIKFESFLTLLNHAQFIIGNSSAGIREAPHFGVPTVNIGTRQNNRSLSSNIIQSDNSEKNISCSIDKALNLKRFDPERHYGNGKSDELFLNILLDSKFWNIQNQKSFVDLIKI